MITYKQIDLNNIQTHETHEDGSYTSGVIRKLAIDLHGNAYSPWDELDPSVVEWLDVPVWQAEQDAIAAISAFKASREAMIEAATVTANGYQFDADEVSIARMSFYTVALMAETDSYAMQWSLADTSTGVMTNITLGDLRLAQQLAVANMATIWGI